METVKRNLEILMVIVILFILLVIMAIQRQQEATMESELRKQVFLVERIYKLNDQIEILKERQETIVIPEINPKFLEWWNGEL